MLLNELHGGIHMHEYLHHFATSCILRELCIGQNVMKGHFYLNIHQELHEGVQRPKYPYCVETSHSINTFPTKIILSGGIFVSTLIKKSLGAVCRQEFPSYVPTLHSPTTASISRVKLHSAW